MSGPSAVTQTLIDQLLARDAHGRNKYGVTLDRTDLTLGDWLQHQAEELMDGAGYALAAKREFKRLQQIERQAVLYLEHPSPARRAALEAALRYSEPKRDSE